jgi:hypothetical protein
MELVSTVRGRSALVVALATLPVRRPNRPGATRTPRSPWETLLAASHLGPRGHDAVIDGKGRGSSRRDDC